MKMRTIGVFLIPLILLTFSCKDTGDKSIQTTPLEIPKADTWWNDDVFYEVFVRSFYDSDGDGIGDFKGIIEKLDYLNDGDPNTKTDLGVTGIWLMPIFPSPSYHGYDVTDYRTVNSQYGSIDGFKLLLSEAHKRGIKVIIDFVINHTSDQHPWFINSSSGKNSDKRNWYVWADSDPGYKGPWGETVWHSKNNAYYYGVFWSGMPDLNYNTNAVTDEMKSITTYWYKDLGIDGFRVDAARHLIEAGQNQENTTQTLTWWRDFYAFQKNLDPGLMTVGEVWSSTPNIAPYADQRLDYCFEFDLSYAIIDAVRNGNSAGLKNKLNEVVSSYPEFQYGTFLTNHDQNRVLEELGLNVEKARMAANVLLTLPGIPYLYYGEEVGMRGAKPDEDIRKPMQWSNAVNAGFSSGTPWRTPNSNYTAFNVATMQADPNSLWHQYRKLISARSEINALRHGQYTAIETANSMFAFLKSTGNQGVLVAHNLGSVAFTKPLFSVNASNLEAGNYTVTEKLTGTDRGTLTVGSNGKFLDFAPLPTAEGMSSYLLVLTKQ